MTLESYGVIDGESVRGCVKLAVNKFCERIKPLLLLQVFSLVVVLESVNIIERSRLKRCLRPWRINKLIEGPITPGIKRGPPICILHDIKRRQLSASWDRIILRVVSLRAFITVLPFVYVIFPILSEIAIEFLILFKLRATVYIVGGSAGIPLIYQISYGDAIRVSEPRGMA